MRTSSFPRNQRTSSYVGTLHPLVKKETGPADELRSPQAPSPCAQYARWWSAGLGPDFRRQGRQPLYSLAVLSGPSASSTSHRRPTSRLVSQPLGCATKLESALPNQPKITFGKVIARSETNGAVRA